MIKKNACRLMSALLVFVLLFSFVGCKKDATWILKVDGQEVPVGLYICYVVEASEEAKAKIDENISASGNASASASGDAEATTVDYEQEKIDGVEYSKWVSDEALKGVKKHVAIEQKFEEFDLELAEEALSTISGYWDSNSEFCEKNGISQTSYTRYLKLSYMKQALIEHYYDVGAEKGVSEEELMNEFTSNYTTAKILQQYKLTVDYTTNSYAPYDDDILEEMRKQLEIFGGRLEKEDDYKKIEKDFQNKMNEITETEATEDSGDSTSTEDTASTSGDADKLAPTPNVNMMTYSDTDEISKGIFDAKIGKGSWVESDQVFCAFVRTDDLTTNPYYLDSVKVSLLSDLRGDDFDKMVEEWGEELDCSVNKAATDTYKAKSIKQLDTTSAQ